MPAPPAAAGAGGLVDHFSGYGPALTALVTNFLATFGDKGQLAVITLATVYDARRIFLGAVTAFAAWNAVEVAFGAALVGAVPPGALEWATGGLFLLFGAWTGYEAYAHYVRGEPGDREGAFVRELLPGSVHGRIAGSGAFVVALVTIAVAEFGDKTQLLTINLAAAFPGAPLSVFLGAWCGLAIRTGLDAFVGETAESYLPTGFIQGAATMVFVGVGLFEWGVLSGPDVVAVAVAAVAFAVGGGAYRRWASPRSA